MNYPVFFRLILVLFFFLEGNQRIKAEYFTIQKYEVKVRLIPDEAAFEVEEWIRVVFSEPRHGIFREIPYKYRRSGKEIKLKIYDLEVPGYNFEQKNERGQVVVKIGDKDVWVDGVQTYHLIYKVKKAFLFEEAHTEFYWNLIGNGWPVQIDTVHFSIDTGNLPALDSTAYGLATGLEGQRGSDASILFDNGILKGESLRPFAAHEGMTVFIRLPLNYIQRPGPMAMWWFTYGEMTLAIALFSLLLFGFFRLWWKYGKDYRVVTVVEYRPPDGLTPAEVGMILDDKVDFRDIISLLPYWGMQGYISIQVVEKSWLSDDHQLTRLSDLPGTANDYERVLFNAIFASGDQVLVSDLKGQFHETLSSAKTLLSDRVKNMGFYYPVSVDMQVYMMVAAFLVLLAGGLTFIWLDTLWVPVALFVVAAIGFIFSRFMLKKNEAGIKVYQKVKGFREFVKTAEKEKLERMLEDDAGYFEKTIPYAMVFGYAAKWSAKFDGLRVNPPNWYTTSGGHFMGTHGFSSFGSSLESSVREINSAFSSVPSSSSDSGGGGGSSGGGFGGGGGGSW